MANHLKIEKLTNEFYSIYFIIKASSKENI